MSLGGLLAAFGAPMLGRVLDRSARGWCCVWRCSPPGRQRCSLSLTGSLLVFYLLLCVALMNFAGPFDLGIYGAVNNWFVRQRARATAIATVARMSGLVLLPLIAQAAMQLGGWRAGWLGVGGAVLAVGLLPNWLLLVHRPEAVGLVPDLRVAGPPGAAGSPTVVVERSFTRAQALRTNAFWLLTLFTVLAYPVQAGVSLHQAAYWIEHGLQPTVAAGIVSTFSLASGAAGLAFGFFPRRWPIRYALALIGALQAAGATAMLLAGEARGGYLAAIVAYPAAALAGC